MNPKPSIDASPVQTKNTPAILKRLAQVLFGQLLLIGLILFAASGRLDWGWAWAYLGLVLAVILVNSMILPPDLIAERGQPKENVKAWDKILTTMNIFPSLGMLIVAGLDQRWGWSPNIGTAIPVAALVCMAAGQGLFSWAMVSNHYFSTMVRIQTDRNQSVASGGPYRFVRHPGYTGFILFTLVTPVILGSLWALPLAGLSAVIFIVRTYLEDRTLQAELPGYWDYARNVHFRLIPGVW